MYGNTREVWLKLKLYSTTMKPFLIGGRKNPWFALKSKRTFDLNYNVIYIYTTQQSDWIVHVWRCENVNPSPPSILTPLYSILKHETIQTHVIRLNQFAIEHHTTHLDSSGTFTFSLCCHVHSQNGGGGW